MTLQQLYSLLRKQLQRKHSSDHAAWVARCLIRYVTGREVWTAPSHMVDHTALQRLQAAIQRLDDGEPLQYVLGEWEFLGIPLEVTPDVLIPRPETEYLVQGAFEMCQIPPRVIWDVGTGSGCIAIGVKTHWPNAKVYAFEKSPSALTVARRNAHRHQLQVRWVEADFLEVDLNQWPVPDLIISNPPYLERGVDIVAPEVQLYEPDMAVYPPGDPLIFYRRIAQYVVRHPQTALALEINPRFRDELIRLFGRLLFIPSPMWHSDYCMWMLPEIPKGNMNP